MSDLKGRVENLEEQLIPEITEDRTITFCELQDPRITNGAEPIPFLKMTIPGDGSKVREEWTEASGLSHLNKQ